MVFRKIFNILIFERKNKIQNMKGQGEDICDAAVREVKEETGVS